ncbi:hypothetical protein [Burkholderia gladioli]|uniref:hypothetical protein n=1 Tax=Burkholderia gladioli TaxID=28095 RepID=UPI001641DF33|nr:hypothetical protein [Burkholderia gladioli]
MGFKLKVGPGVNAEVAIEEATEESFVQRLWKEFPEAGLPPTVFYNSRPVIEFPDGFELSGLQAERWVVNPAYRQSVHAERGGHGTEQPSVVEFDLLAQRFYLAQATAMGLDPRTAEFVAQSNLMRQLLALIKRFGGGFHEVDLDNPMLRRFVVTDANGQPITNHAGVRAPI